MEAITHIDQLPGSFLSPDLITAFTDSEALDVAKSVAPSIIELLSVPTPASIDSLFHPDAVISYKVVPLIKRAGIIPASIILQEDQVLTIALPNEVSVVRASFAFQTSSPDAKCTAAFKFIRMKNGDVKVFTVTTALHELAAVPWQKAPSPVSVEGKHGGLSISAYLKALGINFAMVEKEPTIGDSWTRARLLSPRYDSTTLHTTRLFSGLPFIPFPSDYPQYVPAKLIAQYYAKYTQDMQLPAYPARECTTAVWDAAQARWNVTLQGPHGPEVVTARILVFAIGVGGRWPIMPAFPGQDLFRGESLHSVAYKDATPWAGKRVAVVGASTTACDVAHDCVGAGADTVMVQRGPTRIYPQAHIAAVQALFWNDALPVEVGDVMSTEDPVVLQAALSALVLGRLRDSQDPEYYDSLRRAGFIAAVDGPIHQQIFCRGGAHYPDIGACGAIARGEIKVKSDALIERITPTGLAFSDGTDLDVDVIVYATGFEKDSRKFIAPIVGAEHAAALEPVWGLDAEGEVRGCWRPSGNDHIWFQGGELQTMRYYGKFLALQIVAEVARVRPAPCRV
ncbi:hypothetical protein B0H10DRAFT_2224004 [Mycena sp. CBHHK59/15]|nr:hypothetical protein B0H10DRAFT_2224004 [Mycena sp. CBHHK59/15]